MVSFIMELTGTMGNEAIVNRLRQEQQAMKAGMFVFTDIIFDLTISDALIDIFRRSVRLGREPLFALELWSCSGKEYVNHVLETAVALDVFELYFIYGNCACGRHCENKCRPPLPPFELPMHRCHNLRNLTLSHVTLYKEDAKILRRGLEDDDDGNYRGTMDEACNIDNAQKRLRYKHPRYNRLISLEINDAILEDEETVQELCTGLRNNISLEVLVLENCNLTDGQVSHIVEALMYCPCVSRCANDHKTEASNRQISPSSVHQLHHRQPNRRQFHHHQHVTKSHDCSCHNIERLEIFGNECQEKGLRTIARWLSQPCCSLKALKIGTRRRSKMELKFLTRGWDMTSLSTFINSTPRPDVEDGKNNDDDVQNQELDSNLTLLRGWGLAKEDDVTTLGQQLVFCPARNTSLKKLELVGSHLDDTAMSQLAELVQERLLALEHLVLSWNDLTDSGLASFATESAGRVDANRVGGDHQGSSRAGGSSVPMRYSRLQKIDLFGNFDLTAQASSSILQMLQVYVQLKYVHPNKLWKRSEQAKDIQQLLILNAAGRALLTHCAYGSIRTTNSGPTCSRTPRHIDQGKNGYSHVGAYPQVANPLAVPMGLWPLVLARWKPWRLIGGCEAADGMYYVLRNGPALLERD